MLGSFLSCRPNAPGFPNMDESESDENSTNYVYIPFDVPSPCSNDLSTASTPNCSTDGPSSSSSSCILPSSEVVASTTSNQDRLKTTPKQSTKRHNRSNIWDHFFEVTSTSKIKYAKCGYCPDVQDYTKPIDPKHPGEKGLYKKDGTGNLRKHLEVYHRGKLDDTTPISRFLQKNRNRSVMVTSSHIARALNIYLLLALYFIQFNQKNQRSC